MKRFNMVPDGGRAVPASPAIGAHGTGTITEQRSGRKGAEVPGTPPAPAANSQTRVDLVDKK